MERTRSWRRRFPHWRSLCRSGRLAEKPYRSSYSEADAHVGEVEDGPIAEIEVIYDGPPPELIPKVARSAAQSDSKPCSGSSTLEEVTLPND
jgi:hypothetical protein